MRTQILALLMSLAASSSAFAEMHEVKMLNCGTAGPMVYEPDRECTAPGKDAFDVQKELAFYHAIRRCALSVRPHFSQ